jgi:ankyrin repeat protein
LKYLVSRGADVNARNNDVATPLHYVAHHNPDNIEVFRYLVSQGAGVNAKNNGGWIPLHEAAAHNSNVEVLRYLVSVPGADVNARNHWEGKQQTPLDLADTEEKKSILRAAGGRSGQ